MEIILIFLFGLFIGSFLGVLSDRLPKGETIMGRSHCDYCKKTLQWYDLIPTVSYIWQRGKCRYCHKRLSRNYPIIELITGLAFVSIQYSALRLGSGQVLSIQGINQMSSFYALRFTLYTITASAMIVIFFSDLKYRIIPDEMLVVMLISGLFSNLLNHSIINNFLAASALCSMLSALYFRTRGKGIGFGDVKLAGVIGWLMGIKLGLAAIYFSFLLGGGVAVFVILTKKANRKTKIAFGPFMIAGIIIAFALQREILEFINKLLV